MLSLIRNISRKCVETLEALTDKALVTVLRSPELKQNFLQTTGIYIYIYILFNFKKILYHEIK